MKTIFPATRTAHSFLQKAASVGILFALTIGCGPPAPPATIEGTVRLHGKALENCLVTFLPDSNQGTGGVLYSAGKTDTEGHYRLRSNTQQRGTVMGWHHVTIQDLSASSGTPRRDHGSTEIEATKSGGAMRPSRIRTCYQSPASTPLRVEIKSSHQVVDLDLE